MKQNELLLAVYNYLETIVGIPDVNYPNIEYTTPTTDHLNVFVLNNEPQTIGLASIVWYNGLIQIDSVIEQGKGEIKAAVNAQAVMDAFPIGTILTNGTTSIRIDQSPYASAGVVRDDGWYFIPITIPYNMVS
jgi:hypothetical protein